MGIFGNMFGKGNGGGLMNVIRCDEQEYLVWKWRPAGQEANTTSRENSIRYGSSLRVKDGEVAVFVYKQKDGAMQDFIVGPYDETIKTANFPVLANIVGAAFGGDSPFQAEIYFINLAGIIQVKFAVPYFDVQDPRFPDLSVPVAVGGTISFKVEDYKGFIKVNRLINFTLEDFKKQISDAVIGKVKGLITNVLDDMQCPLARIERYIDPISENLKARLSPVLEDFGVVIRRFDISRIEIDKEDENWTKLQSVTAEFSVKSAKANQDNAINTANAQSDLNIKNMQDLQALNKENLQETMRLQREQMAAAQKATIQEAQYKQHLETQTANMGAYGATLQADVLKTAAGSLGSMGNVNTGSNGGMNPAGMMTGMMLGGAMGQQMAGMVNNMGQNMNAQAMQQANTPPPMPQIAYMISVNGSQSGPYNMQQLQQLVAQGQLTQQTYVWKQGMANWELAGNVAELANLFIQSTPPPQPGGMPPVPPTN